MGKVRKTIQRQGNRVTQRRGDLSAKTQKAQVGTVRGRHGEAERRSFRPVGMSLVLLCACLWVSCTRNPVAEGGTSEQGNAVVVGKIVKTDGTPAANTHVTLHPVDYDPVGDLSAESLTIVCDTTNDAGEYMLVSSKPGDFNVNGIHAFQRSRLLIRNLSVSKDETLEVATDTVKIPESIRISLPQHVDTINGYVYVPGTDIYLRLRDALIVNGTVVLDSVPTEDVDVVFYSSGENDSVPDSLSLSKAPYGPSHIIESILFDTITLSSAAPGSDNWPCTWADDGHLYAAWGNGGGFGGTDTDGRTYLGVARIEGPPESMQGYNVFGGKDPESSAQVFEGKPSGLLSVEGVLYMAITREGSFDMSRICASADHGSTWTCSVWDFVPPFYNMKFLNFGQDNQSARDTFVYAYSRYDSIHILLARVSKSLISDHLAYEFFGGYNASGSPLWSTDIQERVPVFTDSNGVFWGISCVYNPGVDRYLLAVTRQGGRAWGLFDASEPWGPWTTIGYYEDWYDSATKYRFVIPSKWISADGKNFWIVFSGGAGPWDAFNLIRCSLTLR